MMKKMSTPYPILTSLSALLLIAYFLLLGQPQLLSFYQLPDIITTFQVQLAATVVFILILLIELRLFQRRRRNQKIEIARFRQQMAEVLADKKQLHAKTHVYANHADKLKLFISDKLLEYIEYDEKFLHFKSIASEVRHNGVISYDKIKTILLRQISQLQDTDSEQLQQTQEALDSLIYLWDLLDLSTADNIALHIANQVCDSEEQFFQAEFQTHEGGEFPAQNIFSPLSAVQKALQRCFGCAIGDARNGTICVDDIDQAWINLTTTDNILGNENHIVLVLENLLNNAQFFSSRRDYKQKHAGIAVDLKEQQGFVCCQIYNRGPHIDDDTAQNIFQLGYSTRRVKEHHGKGLGLYFVNEIVKGYDGKVRFENVLNEADVLSLRLELADGTVVTEVLELVVEDDRPLCRKSGHDEAVKELDWKLQDKLLNIEITHQSDQKTHRLLELDSKKTIMDPSQPACPRWSLTLKQSHKQTDIHFKPLDISGVRFEIRLPTATARLDGDLLNADEAEMDGEVSEIKQKFKGLEQLG
ncbi:sensor histidine kinase [Gynuella sunshinyii]|uniref:histidine kinase n=1 Tax=Gynuella sunshinyii YC6258 TaxID=1445510 RepID=A0A0C5VFF3_9GAMM|nr:ATP-binding protein [Gynuella sunshinyii]AJQ92906.1 signal transduction histidine kinase regulating citrate/malate metabolism [Gynuella sunshinyii YC6258]